MLSLMLCALLFPLEVMCGLGTSDALPWRFFSGLIVIGSPTSCLSAQVSLHCQSCPASPAASAAITSYPSGDFHRVGLDLCLYLSLLMASSTDLACRCPTSAETLNIETLWGATSFPPT